MDDQRSSDAGQAGAAAEARTLVKSSRFGALATIERKSGAPYVSLVGVAALPDGTPILLLSALARHTRNIESDPRASLLFQPMQSEYEAAIASPLAKSRVSVSGSLVRIASDEVRAVYLARHRDAEKFAEFADFSFYQMVIADGQFIGGFGRIVALDRSDLLEAG